MLYNSFIIYSYYITQEAKMTTIFLKKSRYFFRIQCFYVVKREKYCIQRKGSVIMANLKYEIKETIGIISEGAKGWNKELNLISWNDREAKYDLRDWDQNHEKMGKGITLSKEELIHLKKLLSEMDLN